MNRSLRSPFFSGSQETGGQAAPEAHRPVLPENRLCPGCTCLQQQGESPSSKLGDFRGISHRRAGGTAQDGAGTSRAEARASPATPGLSRLTEHVSIQLSITQKGKKKILHELKPFLTQHCKSTILQYKININSQVEGPV